MDGVFLSPNEDEFVGRIAEELEHFMVQGQHHRVLLFPPLSSRLRYLIHRTVENVDLLSSFSVGEGWRRRTVICHSAVRIPSETSDQKPSSNALRPQRPAQPWGRGGRGARLWHGSETHGDNSRACVGSGRIKRPPRKKPDKALYVPKAMRKKTEWGEQGSTVAAGTDAGGDVAPEEEICPKASVEDTQEELGKCEGDVSLALGKQQEPGEGKSPPCCTDVPSSGNSSDLSGQESQDKSCSDSLPSVPNKPPVKAEGQDQSCENAVSPEGSKILCQLQAEDQNIQDGGGMECSKKSSLSESHSRNRCADPAAAESSAVMLRLEDEDKSCAGAKSLESGGNVSPAGEQSKDFGNEERGKSSSEVESQDQECSSVERNQDLPGAQNEPPAVPEPGCGVDPSALEDQHGGVDPSALEDQHGGVDPSALGDQCGGVDPSALGDQHGALDPSALGDLHRVDAPMQNHSRKVPVTEEEDKEPSGLADVLWREQRLSVGNKEESVATCGQSSLEDDCPAELFAEIVGHLTVKDISIEKISFDYTSYGDAQLSEGDFGHVTEIYDFSPALKTEQIMEVFSDFHESGFKIQWVDDTHALGIFSSSSAASQALGRRYPSLKIRPLIHATKQSKIKALQRPKLLYLAKERPQTDTVVARRLVSRALGLKHKQQDGSGTEVLLPEGLDQEE